MSIEPKESDLQIAFINFMRISFPHVMVWHTYNENAVNAIQGAQRRLKGVLAGVHDNVLVWPPRNMATIELKRPGTKPKYSDKQQAFAERLDKVGFPHACCSSGDEIMAALKRFGLETNTPFPWSLSGTKKQALQNEYHNIMLDIAKQTREDIKREREQHAAHNED